MENKKSGVARVATDEERHEFEKGILFMYTLSFINAKKAALEAEGFKFGMDAGESFIETPAGERMAPSEFLNYDAVMDFREKMGNIWIDVPNAPMMAAAVLAQAALEAIVTTCAFSVKTGKNENRVGAWLDFDTLLFTMWRNGAGGVLGLKGESIIHPFIQPIRMLYMNAFGCAVRRGEVTMNDAVEMMLADWENMAIKTGNQAYVDMIRASIAEFAGAPDTPPMKPTAQA